jgi:hypothetical protein
MNQPITNEQIEILDYLFDPWTRVSIRTKEDIIALGEIFDEEE